MSLYCPPTETSCCREREFVLSSKLNRNNSFSMLEMNRNAGSSGRSGGVFWYSR